MGRGGWLTAAERGGAGAEAGAVALLLALSLHLEFALREGHTMSSRLLSSVPLFTEHAHE
jgi:hypothetical protein